MKALIVLAGLLTAPTALAQTATVTYVLEDVWLKPDITHPSAAPRLMTGTIEWSYTVGDFENGVGEFTELNLPWHNGGGPELAWTIEANQVEVTMPGNWHDWGADVSLKLTQSLSLDQPAPVDLVLSSFDIESFGISRKGHAISGSLVLTSTGELGTAFCFGDGGCPCGNNDPSGAAGCVNSTGVGARLSATGSTGVAADDLILSTADCPADNSGLFFMGASTFAKVLVGDGLGCTGGLFRYFPGVVDPTGVFTLSNPIANAPAGMIQAGDTRHFQSWTRDVLCGPPPTPCPSPCMNGSNLSNGYTVVFTP